MGTSEVIAGYESLAALTARMRQAAARSEWDSLIGIEQQRAKLLESIKTLDADTRLDDSDEAHRQRLIQQVMVDDAEIRTLVERWMGDLQLSIQSNLQEQKLQRTYGV